MLASNQIFEFQEFCRSPLETTGRDIHFQGSLEAHSLLDAGRSAPELLTLLILHVAPFVSPKFSFKTLSR